MFNMVDHQWEQKSLNVFQMQHCDMRIPTENVFRFNGFWGWSALSLIQVKECVGYQFCTSAHIEFGKRNSIKGWSTEEEGGRGGGQAPFWKNGPISLFFFPFLPQHSVLYRTPSLLTQYKSLVSIHALINMQRQPVLIQQSGEEKYKSQPSHFEPICFWNCRAFWFSITKHCEVFG